MSTIVSKSETTSAELPDLRAFCHVVDLGSITAAAKALGETKGTVSRRISRLEHALDVVLVRRSARLVQATDDGKAYRVKVGRALELLDDATAEMQQANAEPRGHLRITAPTDLGLSLIAPLVAHFVEKYPEISVEMIFTETRLDFEAHHIDVAFRAARALDDTSLVAHRLQDLDGRLYAAPSYLAKYGMPRKPEDLLQHRVLLTLGTARGTGTLTLRRAGDKKEETLRLQAVISSADFFACKEAAVAGAGIVMLPTVVARPDLEARRLSAVLKDYSGFSGAMYLVHHATRFVQPRVKVFRDFALESLRTPRKR